MKFNITIILFLLISLSQLNAITDSSSDSIEFSIGGGVKVTYNIIDYYTGYNSNHLYDSTVWPSPISIGIICLVSFIYYINNNFGLGINYYAGLSVTPYYSGYSTVLEVDNSINFVNKIGNNIKRKFFLLEYGIIMKGRYFLCYNGEYGSNFNIGPDIFIGYEYRSKTNKFLYTVGGFFEALFRNYNQINPDRIKIDEYILNFGIEFRWRYCYYR